MSRWSCFTGNVFPLSTIHMLLLALFTLPTVYCHPRMRNIKETVPGGICVMQTVDHPNYVTAFHVTCQLPVKDSQLCANRCGQWAVQLIERMLLSDHYTGGFLETVPRNTAENTVNTKVAVGSMISNQCNGRVNSVTVTTLITVVKCKIYYDTVLC